jgi:nucleoside-diphosphate-sugar epimerase
MKILVTGGSGFVGERLIAVLLEMGHDVSSLDVAPSEKYPHLTRIGDICSAGACEAATAGVNVICHLAALYRDDVRPRERYYEVNVEGTRRLIEAADRNGVRHIVFASSFSVYGLDDAGKSEEGALSPVNDYGKSKLQAEVLLAEWWKAAPGRTLHVLRPSVIFGEGNRGNVWTLVNQIASRRFVMIGAGANRKSMAYVGNIAAYMAELAGQSTGAMSTVNYADKPDMTVSDIVEIASEETGSRVRRLPLPAGFAMALGYLGDLVGWISGRVVIINSERVRKFLANTSLPTNRVDASGFVRPYELKEAFVRTIRAEFPRNPVRCEER